MIKPKVYLSDEDYEKITDSIPIICVDMVLYDLPKKKVGFILRGEKHALIGGRIGLGETIEDAIKRHLKNDLGISEFLYYKCSPNNPVFVYEYVKGIKSPNITNIGFDPTKQSIALTFILTTLQNPKPANESTNFVWSDLRKIDNYSFDFGQQSVIKKLSEAIE